MSQQLKSDPSSVTLGDSELLVLTIDQPIWLALKKSHLSGLGVVASSVERHELVPLPLHVVHLVSAEEGNCKNEEWENV